MAHDPRPPVDQRSFIPGIFKYCDRWCARCPFSRRCRVYAELHDPRGDGGRTSAAPDTQRQIVRRGLEEALQVLRRARRERGLAFEPDDEDLVRHERHERAVDGHPLTQQARQYTALVCDWLRTESVPLRARLQTLRRTTVDVQHVLEVLTDVQEQLTVIEHDETLIGSGVRRAVGSHLLAREFAGGTTLAAPSVQDDASGSAKVALLGIDRSIDAWRGLASHHPDAVGTIGVLQEWLARLRGNLELAFPLARRFRRPGFDDPRASA